MTTQDDNPYSAPPPLPETARPPHLSWWRVLALVVAAGAWLILMGALTLPRMLDGQPSYPAWGVLVLVFAGILSVLSTPLAWRSAWLRLTGHPPAITLTWKQLGALFAAALACRALLPLIYARLFDVNGFGPVYIAVQSLAVTSTGLLVAIPLLIVPLHLLRRWRARRTQRL